MKTFTFVCGLTLAAAAIAAAQAPAGTAAPGAQPSTTAQAPAGAAAKATIKDVQGQTIGEATLRESAAGVLIKVDLRNVPAGAHAFHVHSTGACEAPAFVSAGPHFAPGATKHGLLAQGGPHAGDLPNLHVPADGKLSLEVLASGVTLAAGPRSLLDADGSALVLHAAADDYTTDPAGNAGGRIACGAIVK